MKISSFKLKNYRRLVDVSLVLDDKKTILVGANNSGKTSCIGALHTFLDHPKNMRVRDVSKHNWKEITTIGNKLEKEQLGTEEIEELSVKLANLLPSLDVKISAQANEAYKAREILPHLDWKGGNLAVRIVYEPEKLEKLASDYVKARKVVSEHDDVSLWPKSLFDFLEKGGNFSKYFKQRLYILSLEADGATQPLKADTLKKLIRIDIISEQRGLGNEDSSDQKGPYSEKQRLNKLLREYYDNFLNPDDFPDEGDLDVLKKQQEMEDSFTHRLGAQFETPLKELEDMGYPGIGGNPSVEIAAKISGSDALQKTSSVRYRFNKDQEDTLPESYLGLGYQNLIYLTFRLLGFRDKWMRVGKSASSDEELTEQIEPIHLVLVEEPEVNLHAQVQRVFVAKAYDTLRKHSDLGNKPEYQTQLVVSTHSSHIVNDVDFKDLRYFRRNVSNETVEMDHSVVENMSELFSDQKDEIKFVRKHLKLTHCDIFFADGVIFVEGQAERLLVPEFISKNFRGLSNRYLSILEVNGAHTHKYRKLIEKLGIATLIVTDLDTVNDDGISCPPERGQNQKTNNDTLKSWHPVKEVIDELVDISKEGRQIDDQHSKIFVAYQKPIMINEREILSRTFEDALILANFDSEYFQAFPKLKTAKEDFESEANPLSKSLFDYVQGLSKGDFAFSCLFYLAECDTNFFSAPDYIGEGLAWLEEKLSPNT